MNPSACFNDIIKGLGQHGRPALITAKNSGVAWNIGGKVWTSRIEPTSMGIFMGFDGDFMVISWEYRGRIEISPTTKEISPSIMEIFTGIWWHDEWDIASSVLKHGGSVGIPRTSHVGKQFAGKIIELNGGFPSKPCLITQWVQGYPNIWGLYNHNLSHGNGQFQVYPYTPFSDRNATWMWAILQLGGDEHPFFNTSYFGVPGFWPMTHSHLVVCLYKFMWFFKTNLFEQNETEMDHFELVEWHSMTFHWVCSCTWRHLQHLQHDDHRFMDVLVSTGCSIYIEGYSPRYTATSTP